MSTIDDGGPAFPVSDMAPAFGMSLRDWFAGQALPAAMAAQVVATRQGSTYADAEAFAANTAYHLADAMLAARRKP